MSNLYGNGGFWWWNGVIEDRADPLLLGRCRVRIVGYHNPDKVQLPTEDLPWAYPLQGIGSAAMNGIGYAPVGPVEGTWIMGFFRDGEDCQEPVMLGTFGGIPQIDNTLYETRNPTTSELASASPPLTDPAGNVYVHTVTNESLPTPSATIETVIVGPLNQDEVNLLLGSLAEQASGSAYETVDANGNIGAYRLSAATLMDFGYIEQGAQPQYTKAGIADYALFASSAGYLDTSTYETLTDVKKASFNFYCVQSSFWTQRAGKTIETFLATTTIQDEAATQNLKAAYRFLYRSEIVNSSTSKGDVAGYLTVYHFMGAAVAQDYHNGVVKSLDGISAATYFNIGFKAVGGSTGLSINAGAAVQSPEQIPDQTQPVAPPTPPTIATQPSNADLVQTTPNIGFGDPNNVYPKTDHIGEPDTNRLARHQKLANTVVSKKDATRKTGVPLALDSGTWDQPINPYNALYPYNHVYESESGHVVEYDDTAGNERTHRYHKSGTFEEVDVNGTRVTRIVGDDYTILERNGFIFINGKANVTIEGTCNVKIAGNCNLEVDGDLNTLVHNDATIGIAGNLKLAVGGDIDIRSLGDMKLQGADVHMKGTNIHTEASENYHIKASEKLLLKSDDDLSIRSSAKIIQNAGSELDLKATAAVKVAAGGTLALDGAGLALLSGVGTAQTSASSAEGADDADAGTAGNTKTITEPIFPELRIPSRSEEFAYVLDGITENVENNGEALATLKATAIADGTVKEEDFLKEPTASTVDDTRVAARVPLPPECGEISGMINFPSTLQLSEYFTLGMLSSGAVVTKVAVLEQHNLTKQEIVCNLKELATQVLDPIREHYPTMIVTSGFRTPIHSVAINSQHEYGCAADLQFVGMAKNSYVTVAQWIRDNIPFDQLLLEFKSFGTGLPWIHVSYNSNKLRADLRTMWNDRSYPDASTHALVDLSGNA